jgi:hypothetical protein
MSNTWRFTVLIDNKDVQDVTVQADDAWRAKGFIERQYGEIIAGPSRVFTPPNLDESYLLGSSGGRSAPAKSRPHLSVAEVLMFALWIGAVAFFRSRGFSWQWVGTGTGILALGIVLRNCVLHELRKRTKRFVRGKDL